MAFIHLISALTVRTRHTNQARTTSWPERLGEAPSVVGRQRPRSGIARMSSFLVSWSGAHAEEVAAEVARRPLAVRLVRARHQQGGSTSSAQQTASLESALKRETSQVAIGPGAQNRCDSVLAMQGLDAMLRARMQLRSAEHTYSATHARTCTRCAHWCRSKSEAAARRSGATFHQAVHPPSSPAPHDLRPRGLAPARARRRTLGDRSSRRGSVSHQYEAARPAQRVNASRAPACAPRPHRAGRLPPPRRGAQTARSDGADRRRASESRQRRGACGGSAGRPAGRVTASPGAAAPGRGC
mmetsp:Transcript_16217/g.41067  ORF Transcript_16217/g.41067 Transcript_16217/m.41067 type:complete len:299 (+) Transcript_16217:55-951(+)